MLISLPACTSPTFAIAAYAHAVAERVHTFLTQSREEREREREEAYLAEAVDCCDLEWRMRELDRRRNVQPHWLHGFNC